MKLNLLKSLLNKEFYDLVKTRVPDEFFGSDDIKIKYTIDEAHKEFKRTLTPEELEAYFFSTHPTLTTADRNLYNDLFAKLKKADPIGEDIADNVLSSLWRNVLAERIVDIGFKLAQGDVTTMAPIKHILEEHNDTFLPKLNVEFEDLTPSALLQKNSDEGKWKFNLPPLARRVPGVSGGHFIVLGARPNAGKTSFHASMVAGPNGFAHQGARVGVLCNEEGAHRVGMRYLTACTGMSAAALRKDISKADELFGPIRKNILLLDSTGWDTNRIESFCKSYEPDILVLDMIDKVNVKGSYARPDEKFRAVYQTSRDIAKEWDCAVFGFSQLSAEAEGVTRPDMSMLEGSRTGKAAEADLMLLLGKARANGESIEHDDGLRWLNIAKNKLTGIHVTEVVTLDGQIALYGE